MPTRPWRERSRRDHQGRWSSHRSCADPRVRRGRAGRSRGGRRRRPWPAHRTRSPPTWAPRAPPCARRCGGRSGSGRAARCGRRRPPLRPAPCRRDGRRSGPRCRRRRRRTAWASAPASAWALAPASARRRGRRPSPTGCVSVRPAISHTAGSAVRSEASRAVDRVRVAEVGLLGGQRGREKECRHGHGSRKEGSLYGRRCRVIRWNGAGVMSCGGRVVKLMADAAL